MGGSQLVRVLQFFGFLCVNGFTEKTAPGMRAPVTPKKPSTYGYNQSQGLTVVYDEVGRPWVRPGYIKPEFISPYLGDDNVYTPFSRDGGEWVRNTFGKGGIYVLGNYWLVRLPRAVDLLHQASNAEAEGRIEEARSLLRRAGFVNSPQRLPTEEELEESN